MKRLALLLLLIAPAAFGQAWSGVLSSSRAIDWTQSGVQGGIPSASWTQCGSTIAAYSGSPSTIINALQACAPNTYVLLGPGTFTLSGAIITTGKNNVVLRGSGANSTLLVFSAASTCQEGNGTCLVGFQSSDSTYPAQPPAHIYNWTGGYAKGATSITLSSTANISTNSTMIFLDQCDTGYSGSPCAGTSTDNGQFFECSDAYTTTPTGCAVTGPDAGFARPHRFQWEIVTATAISGSTITITPPLQHPQWASGQTPQAWLVEPCMNDGIENLSVNGASTTDTAGVSFTNCINGWVSGVAVLNSYNIGIWLYQSAHMTVESNYVYNAGQHLTYTDPCGIKHNGSNNLIDNNIIQAIQPFMSAEGPENGTVIAYNFGINAYTGNDFLFGGIWNHSEGDDYDLYEGNVTDQLFEDQIHGSHLMNTAFRNFFTGWESCANGQCGSYTAKDSSVAALDDLSFDRYFNAPANVLGTPGNTTAGYTSSTNEYDLGGVNGYVYILGSGDQGGATPIPLDPVVVNTSMRWDNWDAYHNSIQCNNSEVPTGDPNYPNAVPGQGCSGAALPASFYLSAQPIWWGTEPWPPIGPDVTGGNVGQCTGTPNTSGEYAGVAALTSGQCTGTSITPSSYGGHVNATPAMKCALNSGMPPDGSGSGIVFNAAACYPPGGGGSGSVTVSPTTLSCASVVASGSSGTCGTLTLTNSSGGTITLAALTFTGHFSQASTTCGSTLTNTSSCTYTITFSPTTLPIQVETGTVSVNYTGFTGSPLTVPATGTSGCNSNPICVVGSANGARITTLPIGTATTGQPIVVVVGNWANTTTPTVADNLSTPTVFTTLKVQLLSGDGDSTAIYCGIPTVTGTDTLTFGPGGANILAVAYKVAGATCTNDAAPASNNTLSSTVCGNSALSITTSTNNDFLVMSCGLANGLSSFTVGTGWQQVLTNSYTVGGAAEGQIGAGQIGSTAGTFNAGGTYTPTGEQATILVALKPISAAPPNPPTQLYVMSVAGTLKLTPGVPASGTLTGGTINLSGPLTGPGPFIFTCGNCSLTTHVCTCTIN
jgi:hypothetical protein